jgi:cell division protein FtsI (penicillin-binding protein 3)
MKKRHLSTHERLAAVACVIVLWVLGLGTRLVHLQVYSHDWLEARAARQQERIVTVSPTRGRILDREGREFARSVEMKSIYATNSEIKDPTDVARRLAPILGLPEKTILDRLTDEDRKFVCLKRKVDPSVSDAVAALAIDGIDFVAENKRVYPRHELAAQILGYCGVDENGLAGLELVYDKEVRGREGRVILASDARRRTYDSAEVAPTPGNDLKLTIDAVAQYRVEQVLQRGVRDTGAKWGIAIVMKPRTGEILAIANCPTFDPNEFGKATDDQRRNRAVEAIYEPGSTFKIVAFSGCLEENLITPATMVDCQGGSITVAGRVVHDHPFGTLPAAKALAVSSNVAAIKMGMRLGNERFYDYIRRFGFGARTGIEVPGETAGLLQPVERWQPTTIGSVPMGHEIGVTALQAVAAMSTIANDGVWARPHVVDHMITPDGTVVDRRAPETRRVVSEETARLMTGMLEDVVLEGTAKHAGLESFRAAGKTGTAQKIDPRTKRYSSTKYVASFCGFAPANDPELACIVVLDEPHRGGHTGGATAAPIFGAILGELLGDTSEPAPVPSDRIASAGGGQSSAARSTQLATAAPVEDSRPGIEMVEASYREGGVVVPDFAGMGLRAAMKESAERGLVVEAEGSGRVGGQSVVPGTVVPPGTRVRLRLTR